MAKLVGVYQDKKTKKWYYSVSLGFDAVTGIRIQKVKRGFKTQKEAYESRTKLLQEAQEMGQISNNQMTYRQFLEEIYIPEYKSQVEFTTFESRLSVIDKMNKQFGKKKVADISALDVQRWKNSLTNQYSQNYARLVYGVFSKTLKKAVSLGMVKKNIAEQVGYIPKGKISVNFWTKSEFEKVLNTFDLSDYYEHYSFVVVWLYFMTGLRVNEATALLWKRDIDLEKQTLNVNHSLRWRKDDGWEFGSTKTKAGKRMLALDSDTIQILTEWKQKQEHHGKIDFVLSYNGSPSHKSTINRIVKRHGKLANVTTISAKGLRHSHASLLINEQNVNPLIIKDRLGHEDIKTTLGTYGHLYDNTNFEVANKLSGIVNVKTATTKQTQFHGNQSFKYKEK